VDTKNKDGLVEGEVVEFVVKESLDGRLQAFDVCSPGGGSLSVRRNMPAKERIDRVENDEDEDEIRGGAVGGAMEVDFELLGQLFEVKGPEELPEVLWYLSVFLRAVGYEDGLEGRMARKLIKALGKLGKVSTARLVLDALPVRGVEEWTELVVAYFRQGEEGFEGGLKALQEMRDLGEPPLSLTYLRVIHQLTKTGQTSRAVEILAMMEKDQDIDYHTHRESCYTKIVKGFIAEGSPQTALRTIQEKEEVGFELSTDDFCQVMGGFGAGGDWTMVLELLRTMYETGPAPDIKTFLTVTTALKASDRWEECMAVLRQMRRRAVARGSVTAFTQLYTAVLQLMLDQGKSREAMEVVGFVEEDRVLTDSKLADLIYQVERSHWSNTSSQAPAKAFQPSAQRNGSRDDASSVTKLKPTRQSEAQDRSENDADDWTVQFDKMFGEKFDSEQYLADYEEEDEEEEEDMPFKSSPQAKSEMSADGEIPEGKKWVKSMVDEWLDEETEEEEEEEWVEGSDLEEDLDKPENSADFEGKTAWGDAEDDQETFGALVGACEPIKIELSEEEISLANIKKDLEMCNMVQLKAICKQLGVKGYSRMKKAEIQSLIRDM